jgi:formylglycine-generating enzyme required for sulfatase activity
VLGGLRGWADEDGDGAVTGQKLVAYAGKAYGGAPVEAPKVELPKVPELSGTLGGGIQDLAGTVMEWTSSSRETARVFLGGGLERKGPHHVMATSMGTANRSHRKFDLGFRCARTK